MNMSKRLTALKKPKMQLLLLLLLLAAVAIATGGDRQAKALVLAVSLTTAIIAEWAFFGAVPTASLQSAAISGSIVGMLVSPSGNLLVAWAAAVAAIASKRLLVFREGKHIFNPAACGLLFSVLAFGNQLNWWGNSSALVVVVGAGLLMLRLRRFSLPFSYFIARTATATLIGGGGSLSGALLLPNLFFAFIMLVEPKTSPARRSEQWVFGSLCGLLATVYYRYLPAYEGDILALLTLNLLRPLLALMSWPGGTTRKRQQIQNGGQTT
jgi:Na+-translocating ferredoxin:NAD+ oxidoreductase RnfD subunit